LTVHGYGKDVCFASSYTVEEVVFIRDQFRPAALPRSSYDFITRAPHMAVAPCCIFGQCTGGWRVVPNCAWAAVRSGYNVSKASAASAEAERKDKRVEELTSIADGDGFHAQTTTCMMHESLAPLASSFLDTAWLRDIVKRRTIAFVGHSHVRQLFQTFLSMAHVVARVKVVAYDNDKENFHVGVFDAASGRCIALHVFTTQQRFADLDVVANVTAGRVTDFVFSRGMWELARLGDHPEDMRVQLQFFLAETRRRFPATSITVVPTHFVHQVAKSKLLRCMRPIAQLVYRDAVFAAVHNFNEGLLPTAAFRRQSNVSDGDAAGIAKFVDPVRVLDLFNITGTPEARRVSNVLSDGHHYAKRARISFVVQLLRGDNAAPPPPTTPLPMTPTAEEHAALGIRAASRLPWHGNRSADADDPAILAYYDAVLLRPAFHRLRSNASFLGRGLHPCDQCSQANVGPPGHKLSKLQQQGTKKMRKNGNCVLTRNARLHSCDNPVVYVSNAGRKARLGPCLARALDARWLSRVMDVQGTANVSQSDGGI
jgi:hypothetical protein